ncbi:Fc.00g081040.m01.CDS01 [Cosmosporella sp. VM-42]
MSGLEALALACSVMQVISFAVETIPACKAIYDGKPTSNDRLKENAAAVAKHTSEIQIYFNKLTDTSEYDDILAIAKKCEESALELGNIVPTSAGEGSWTKAVKTKFKDWRNKNKVEKLEKSFQDCAKIMETQILLGECIRNHARELRQSAQFSDLSQELRHFVSQYAAGHLEVLELVRSEHRQTRDHTTKEATTAAESVKAHVTTEIKDLKTRNFTAKQRKRFLSSLKFKDMNARRNAIMEPNEATFNRIFGIRDVTGIDSEVCENHYFPIQGYSGFSKGLVDQTWDDFVEWLQSDGELYWISGKPGSGKSTLMQFLTTHDDTERALNKWTASTTIISHFFWKIGSELQSSIKGLLCSLLYQILSGDKNLVDQILNQFQEVQRKDSVSDWSVGELRCILLEAMELCSGSLCIFIDGLDEVSDRDGAENLMKIVDLLRKQQKVKLCVSSRPERRFELRLGVCPRLQLHKLVWPDMQSHVNSSLGPLLEAKSISVPTQEKIAFRLVERSDGVFLWLYLALQSIREGIVNEDGEAELLLRLQHLPREIEKLYSDMWMRLNESKAIYREKAARYFNLIIAWNGQATLCQVMAANHLQMDDVLFKCDLETVRGRVEKLVEATQKEIRTRCAGLLEVRSEGWWREESTDPLGVHTHVHFMHRTAHDFLVNTEAGKEILRWDTFPLGDHHLNMVKGSLCQAEILHRLCQGRSGRYINTSRTLDQLERVLETKKLRPFLLHAWDMYDRGALIGTSEDYLAELASYRSFDWFVFEEVDTGGSSLATAVLQDLQPQANPTLVPKLLDCGASPDSKAPPVRTLLPGKFTRMESALALMLQRAAAEARKWPRGVPTRTSELTAESILILLQATSTDFRDRTTVVYRMYEYEDFIPVQDILNYPEMRKKYSMFILDVNISYLVKIVYELYEHSIMDDSLLSKLRKVHNQIVTLARPFAWIRFYSPQSSTGNSPRSWYTPLIPKSGEISSASLIRDVDATALENFASLSSGKEVMDLRKWKEVDFSDLYILAEERLGVCFTSDLVTQHEEA